MRHRLQGDQGHSPERQLPAITGHEPSGIVAEVRSGVTEFAAGDEVIVAPSGYCGLCEHCRVGNTHYCVRAFTTGGDGPNDIRMGRLRVHVDDTGLHLPEALQRFFRRRSAHRTALRGVEGVVQYSQMQVGDDVVVIAWAGSACSA